LRDLDHAADDSATPAAKMPARPIVGISLFAQPLPTVDDNFVGQAKSDLISVSVRTMMQGR
jgi:hypothetical protein